MSKRQKVSLLHLPTLINPQELVLNKMTDVEEYMNNKYSSYLRSMSPRLKNWYDEELKNPIYLSPICNKESKNYKYKRSYKINLDNDEEFFKRNAKLNGNGNMNGNENGKNLFHNINIADIVKENITESKKNYSNIKIQADGHKQNIYYSYLNSLPIIELGTNFNNSISKKNSSIFGKSISLNKSKFNHIKSPKFNKKNGIDNVNKLDIKFYLLQ